MHQNDVLLHAVDLRACGVPSWSETGTSWSGGVSAVGPGKDRSKVQL